MNAQDRVAERRAPRIRRAWATKPATAPGAGSGAAARGTAVPRLAPGAVALAPVLALAVLAACGGDGRGAAAPPPANAASAGGAGARGGSAEPAGAITPSRPPASPAALPGSPGTAPAGSARAATARGTAAPSGTASPRTTPSDLPSSAPMTVRLASDCVTPGGTQRVVVDTLPEAHVAYDNLYADGRDGSAHGGVDGQARSDARGHFEASWVVSPGAPLGDVRLDIGVSGGGRATIRMLFYRLATTCP